MPRGLKAWWPSEPTEIGIHGFAEFETFDHLFQVLINGSSIESVTLQHRWYSNWSWIVSANRDKTFFEGIDQQLNDDCIREIVKHIDILHRLYFASINERFRSITLEGKLSSNLRIFPSSVGVIGLMNFRFLLKMFGSLVINLSVSLTSFPSTFGFYFTHIKTYILDIIYACTGPKLKKIHLYDFDLNETDKKSVDGIVQLFVQRGIEVNFS